MFRNFGLFLAAMLALAGCEITTGAPQTTTAPRSQEVPDRLPASRSRQAFQTVVQRVMPVAEQTCRAETRNTRCDFLVIVDDRPGLQPNAYQTLDERGRPVIGFTASLIVDARNTDELAFILGHEAAHHIAGHIPRQQQSATQGAIVGAVIAGALGLDPQAAGAVQQVGGTVGARRYSKDFELEADAIGARIAIRAGYDALRGAQYFNRVPDPGDRFLGTHPPNAERMETVRRVAGG